MTDETEERRARQEDDHCVLCQPTPPEDDPTIQHEPVAIAD